MKNKEEEYVNIKVPLKYVRVAATEWNAPTEYSAKHAIRDACRKAVEEHEAQQRITELAAEVERLRVEVDACLLVIEQQNRDLEKAMMPRPKVRPVREAADRLGISPHGEEGPPPRFDSDLFDEDPGECSTCGEPHEHVRPGKTQPTCECHRICPIHHVVDEYRTKGSIRGHVCPKCHPQ